MTLFLSEESYDTHHDLINERLQGSFINTQSFMFEQIRISRLSSDDCLAKTRSYEY